MTSMIGESSNSPLAAVSVSHRSASPHSEISRSESSHTVQQAQQIVYDYLLNIVKSWMPGDVLTEFKHLFIHHSQAANTEVLICLHKIIFLNAKQEFCYTLKRACYILINNWDVRRNHELIQQLIELFSDSILDRPSISPTLKRLHQWLREFAASTDFQELKLYVERYDQQKQNWTHHFASYLLASQFANLNNSIEQRQAACKLSRQLREQFKFDLARYTALSQSSISVQRLKNPTGLGDRVLHLIKRIVLRRGSFSYSNIARIFIGQIQGLSYQEFKQSLLEYLTFSLDHPQFVQTLQEHLAEKLVPLYGDRDNQPITSALLMRTANRMIDYLLTENGEEPSALFILLLSRGNALLLVIVLLKIVLVCRYVRVHLETRIAEIIRYYKQYPEEECRQVIDFLEILHITLTIYTENVQYTLVNMNQAQRYTGRYSVPQPNLETYRIFSQMCSTQARLNLVQSSFSQVTMTPAQSAEVGTAGSVEVGTAGSSSHPAVSSSADQEITPV
ncbi:hypothetical protein [Leptolyngbya sp. FACHB-711]|uniref:hypothetical protein n=1 Tax=Leptolyngbya sp. ST-U4 TaxID=2933912 RepID=UPI00168689F1|nr:hypothetical protein [Cyanobacteria bacterium FACHB-502]MBD2027684.1 hypothetical protein [Leptolyngbya sp. FACHB-711]